MLSTKQRVVITYGTFDLFHVGHLRLLERLRNLGDYLIVAVSTDDFNARKGKTSAIAFEDRIEIVGCLRCVDLTISEQSWEQKVTDIQKYGVSVFGMGDDWAGRFDDLKDYCEVAYLNRTQGISTTLIKESLPITRFNRSAETAP